LKTENCFHKKNVLED